MWVGVLTGWCTLAGAYQLRVVSDVRAKEDIRLQKKQSAARTSMIARKFLKYISKWPQSNDEASSDTSSCTWCSTANKTWCLRVLLQCGHMHKP